MNRASLLRSLRTGLIVGLPLAFIAGGYWRASRPVSGSAARPEAFRSGQPVLIKTVATDSRRTLPVVGPDGSTRVAPVLPSLEAALALDSRLSYGLRLEVVHALKGELTQTQVGQLMAFVGEVRVPAELTVGEVRALKNDGLNVLVAQKGSQAALAALLRRIHDDPAQEAGLRDYALQFLATLAETAGTAPQWQAVQGSDSGLAATALLQLQLRARDGKLSAEERAHLAQAASKLAADVTQPETSRSTALLICGQLKVAEARPLAWDVARSAKAGYPFRIAAIATLGDLGGDAAIHDYLKQLAVGPEQRLRTPATAALKRITLN